MRSPIGAVLRLALALCVALQRRVVLPHAAGDLPLDRGLFPMGGRTLALLAGGEPAEAFALSLLSRCFPFVRRPLPLIGDVFTLIGEPVALVRESIALLGERDRDD